MLTRSWMLRLLVLAVVLTVSAGPALAAPVVWFDEGHAQAFTVGAEGELQLTKFGQLFREAGFEVRSGGEALTPELLRDKQALVISGPFQPLGNDEIKAILEFVETGGRLAVMLHIGPPLSGLLQSLGVVHSNGSIHEEKNVLEGEPLNFRATVEKEHPVTANLEGFALYGSWALLAEGKQTEVLARSSSESWVDLNRNNQRDPGDARQSFAVLVHGTLGEGAYLVFGDDAVFQNRFLSGDNLTLARNLAAWLQAGSPKGKVVMRAPAGGPS